MNPQGSSGAVAPAVIEGVHLGPLAALWTVLTIRAATSPGYYERAEFARDDYYAEAGAAPGRWIGREAEALGLSGAPRRGDLEALLEGRHPRDGEPLSRSPFRRTNAGFDLTFTAPKSMSVLAAVGDQATRRAVIAAHEAGVAAGLDYLERHECQARRGAGGHRDHRRPRLRRRRLHPRAVARGRSPSAHPRRHRQPRRAAPTAG